MLPAVTADAPLLVWLLAALQPMKRTRVKELLQQGRIHVNGKATTRHDHPLRPGDRVTLGAATPRRVVGPPPLSILYEDDAVVVVDKPAGLLTVATEAEKFDTAFVRLSVMLVERGAGRPYVVHRLDRDTSGLLLFARSPEARDLLQEGWVDVTKTYRALVEGAPRDPAGTIESYLIEGRDLRVRSRPWPEAGAKLARTHYRTLSSADGRSLLEVDLETGRKHQIRVHLAGLGCPVIGDAVYGARTDPAGRLGLHAWRLAFASPEGGGRVEVEARWPRVLALG